MSLADRYDAPSHPTVLVFRRELLPRSETFIVNQAAALTRYQPILVGTRAVPGGAAVSGVRTMTMTAAWLSKPAELGLVVGVPSARFRRALDEASVVHAHFGPDAALLLRVLQRRAFEDRPFVVTFHGYDATVADGEMRRLGRHAHRFVQVRRELFDRADAIVAVSEFIADRLVRAGADARKIIVHYIGVDTSFFCAPTRSTAPPPRVVFLGRLHPKKGAAHLLEALVRLRARGVDAPCTIAGDGPELATLRAFTAAHALDVEFAGAVDPAAARALLQTARVFCVPSITAPNGDAEGFGLVFAEAQACAVPVVSYRSGGVPEAVADRETGLLADEGDVDGLAAHLERLLTDDARWLSMSAAGRARVGERFDLRRQTAELERIYDTARGDDAGQ